MYAIIRTGGKQYKVRPGEKVRVDSVKAEVGASIEINDVLAIHDGESLQLGNPTVASAQVRAQVAGHGRGRKIIVFRSKRRGGHRAKNGHRQDYTEVVIEAFLIDGQALELEQPAPAPEPEPVEEEPVEVEEAEAEEAEEAEAEEAEEAEAEEAEEEEADAPAEDEATPEKDD